KTTATLSHASARPFRPRGSDSIDDILGVQDLMEPGSPESTFSRRRRGTLLVAKMGRTAHCEAPNLWIPSRHWAMRTACQRGEHSREPAAPTPRSRGLFHFRFAPLRFASLFCSRVQPRPDSFRVLVGPPPRMSAAGPALRDAALSG